MKRKGVGGRPTLAESLAKRSVDEKQRKILFNFGLSVASPVTRKDEGPTSETAATRNDESTPSVSGSSSGVFATESASEVGSSVSCLQVTRF